MVQIKTLFLWFSHIYPYLLPIEKILQFFCDIQKQLIIELRRRKVNFFVFKIRLTYSLKYLEKIFYWIALTKNSKFATTHLSRYRNVKKNSEARELFMLWLMCWARLQIGSNYKWTKFKLESKLVSLAKLEHEYR